MQVSRFLKRGRSCSPELLIGLPGWKSLFLGEEEETGITGVTFLPRKRFEQFAIDMFDENSPIKFSSESPTRRRRLQGSAPQR
ncbi:hypothetical protein SLA2020_088130 [Shorea laevis]